MKLWIAAMLLTLTVPCLTTAERKWMYDMDALAVSTPVFNHGETIPVRYSCDEQIPAHLSLSAEFRQRLKHWL